MFGNDIFTRVKRSENKKMAEIAQFLHENDLSVDTTVEVFITVTRDEKLIACGGIAGNIIKCVAISESVRGEGLALTLATELINLAYERHSTHLFIYTKTEYEALFRQCGFSTLTSVPGVMVLMENSATRLKRYAESLKKFRHEGEQDWLHCDERQSLYEWSPLSDSTGCGTVRLVASVFSQRRFFTLPL